MSDDTYALEERIAHLAHSRAELDCRFAGKYWEASGRHCSVDSPCKRCEHDKAITGLQTELARVTTELKTGTAKKRYDELHAADDAMDAVERLRFFCSLAMKGDDWLDVEPFFDEVIAELAEARRRAERYEILRRMNVRQFADTYKLNISTGKPFDEIIDELRPFFFQGTPRIENGGSNNA